MSDGYPTAAQKEALRLICDHEPLEAGQLGERLVATRRLSTNPGFGPAIARMAGTLTWRLQAQGFIAEAESGNGWTPTAAEAEDGLGIGDLGDIVAVPPVREARDRGALKAEPMFGRITAEGVAWPDGTGLACDVIIWCTGFRPALNHLAPLRLRGPDGLIPVDGTRVLGEPRLHLLGYGDWTGPASATLIGAARTARTTVAEVMRQLAL